MADDIVKTNDVKSEDVTDDSNTKKDEMNKNHDEFVPSILYDPPTTAEMETQNTIEKDMKNLPKNKRALPADSETYMLESFEKNIMLIFNQENIDGYPPRKGTKQDVQALQETFQKFRFHVQPHNDLYRKEISQTMLEFSYEDFTDYGCIAIVVLTHGSAKSGLRARDEKYREQKILELLKKNPTVATKPIIYIIQACRGTRLTQSNDVIAKTDSDSSILQYKLPQQADTLVLHSTYASNFSFRHTDTGSWFIQTLCQKVNEMADSTDLESIMTAVKREVAINKELIIITGNEKEVNKQMPVTESTLIRKLFLKRNELGIIKMVLPAKSDKATPCFYETNKTDENRTCELCGLVAVERFDYIYKSLQHFYGDNPKNNGAKSLLTIAKSCSDAEAKIEMALLIRSFLIDNAKDNEKYKYLYVWKEHDD